MSESPPACHGSCRQVVERHPGGHVAEVEGKERRGERPQDPVVEAEHRRAGAPDVDAHPVVPERREEPEALEVIEVEVGQEEVDAPGAAFEEVDAERADAGTGVQDERRPVVEKHLDARCVAAVGLRGGTGRRYRATTAPDLQAHGHIRLAPPEDHDDSHEFVGVREER